MRWLPLPLVLACAPAGPASGGGAVDSGLGDEGSGDGGAGGGGQVDTGVEAVPGGGSGTGATGDPDQLCHIRMACPDGVDDEPKRACSLEVESGDGLLLYEGVAGVELRGRSSLAFPKPQYGLELRSSQEDLVSFGSTWRFWDGATPPTGDWTAADFDDGGWSVGAAPLGYGEAVETGLSYGGDADDKHLTAWFRLTFSVSEAQAQGAAVAELAVFRDDGVAVYLDGEEVLRDNLPADAGPETLASETMSGSWETTPALVELPPLEAGEHVLAVEVHQASASSSDLYLDLRLAALGEEVAVDLFGMGAESDWILNGAYIDRALFRNQLLFDLFQDLEAVVDEDGDRPAPGSRYAAETVFCTLERDGEPQGIHVLTEKVKRDEARLDLAADDGTGQSFIVKLDDRSHRGGIHDNAVGYGTWRLVYPREQDATEAQIDGVRAALRGWEAAHWGDPADPEAGVFAHLDLDSAVDWVILQELSKNNDAYYLSVYLWRDAGGAMHLLPWDMDLTFGYPYTTCHAEDWVAGRASFVQTMAEVPAFRERLQERWWDLRETVLTEEALLDRVDRSVAIMAPAIDENVALWPVDEIAFSWGGVDNWLCPVETYEEELERVRDFLPARLEWMDAHIDAY